ncbi:MAG: Hpt domain-containing protein, partial [Gemmataceae bacterium]|nr:Hpt domain-containing protein [Gemmataceae bacterium]
MTDPSHYRELFFDEASGQLAALESALHRLDARPLNPEAVADGQRAAHSLKGGAEAVGLAEVGRFAAAVEAVLHPYRDRPEPLPRRVGATLLRACETLVSLVQAARTDGMPPPGTNDLLDKLLQFADQSRSDPSADPAPTETPTWRVTVEPHRDAFLSGLDPLVLMRDLGRLGTVARVEPDLSALPPLADLDPERCFVSWSLDLRT